MINAVPFRYKPEITCISRKQFQVHQELYQGYVKKTNEITEILQTGKGDVSEANSTYSKFRGLKVEESFALDGVILHELYFQGLGGAGAPGEATTQLITQFFGSYQDWEDAFKACAKSARGWCILMYEQRTQMLRNILLDSHDKGIVAGAYPILVLDMYEHAYFVDYANQKNDYIDQFMTNINWAWVDQRIQIITQSE